MTANDDVQREETADYVLGHARTAGLELSRDQIERWHHAGALPSPSQRPLGLAGGSVTFISSGADRRGRSREPLADPDV